MKRTTQAALASAVGLLAAGALVVLLPLAEPGPVRAARAVGAVRLVTPTPADLRACVVDCLGAFPISTEMPGATATATATATVTSTATPSLTMAPTITATATVTRTPSPSPTPPAAHERLCAKFNINLRAAPDAAAARVGRWVAGECILPWTFRYDADVAAYPYLWAELNHPALGLVWGVAAEVDKVTGAVTAWWATFEVPPTPAPTATWTPWPTATVEDWGDNRIGVHVVQGSRTGFGDWLRAKAPPVAVKAVDDIAPVCEAEAATNGAAITVYRWNGDADLPGGFGDLDPVQLAQSWYARQRRNWQEQPCRADYYELVNEPACCWVWLGRFLEEAVRWAAQDGYRLAAPCFPTGVPEPEDWWFMADALRTLAEADGAVCVHEYALGADMAEAVPDLVGRFLRVRAALCSMDAGACEARILITEMAENGGHRYPGSAQFRANYALAQELLNLDGHALAFWYTLGDWASANYQDELAWMAAQ